MILALLVAAALPVGHLPACVIYDQRPGAAERAGAARRIAAAAHHAIAPGDIEATLGTAQWRFVWARPRDAEPGVFVLRGGAGHWRFVDVWGGVTSDAPGAAHWATGLGAPAALANCFAARLVAKGP